MKKDISTAVAALFILLAPAVSLAQGGAYLLKGKIGQPVGNSPKAYLFYSGAKGEVMDSALVKNGQFQFRGVIAEPLKAMLVLDHKGQGMKLLRRAADRLDVYLEPGTTTISSPDSVSKAQLKGGPYNTAYNQLRQTLRPGRQQLEQVEKSYNQPAPAGQTKEAYQAGVIARYEALEKQQKQLLADFIRRNPSSSVSLDALQQVGGVIPEYTDVAPLYAVLSAPVQNSKAGQAYAGRLASLKNTAVGAAAPEFEQATPKGKTLKLSDLKGKYVLVDFWASWCGPCRQENPNVVQVYNQFKDRNFTVLGVSLDQEKSKEAWVKAIATDQLAWPQVSDLKGFNNQAAVLYGVQAIPQNFLVDPSGRIVAKNLRGKALGEKLAQLVK